MSVKRNGVHAIFEPGVSYTRTPKKIQGLEHIELALRHFKIPVVGEVVIPGLDFEEASGLIRSGKTTQNAEVYIFNAVINDLNFTSRRHLLETMKLTHFVDHPFIHFEKMHVCNNVEAFDNFYKLQTETCKEEGVCWISPHHVYQPGKRTWDWMKRVPMMSIEVKIIEILPGTKGKKYEHSMGRMLCYFINDKGERKEVKVGIFKGQTDEWRQKMYNNRHAYTDSPVTIEFKNYTKYGIPAQPRFKAFRWDL
jgi:ATP-dependent DNA ligase